MKQLKKLVTKLVKKGWMLLSTCRASSGIDTLLLVNFYNFFWNVKAFKSKDRPKPFDVRRLFPEGDV